MLGRLLAVATLISGAGAATLSFDVASIRTSQAAGRRESIHTSPDSVMMRNVSLKSCVGWAYHVMEYQVTAPDWLSSERFDIVAKASGSVPEDDLRTMMQALLADRFKVESHRQSKEMSAYALVPAKGGPKVHESTTQGASSIQPDRARLTVTVQRGRMPELIDLLERFFHAPVIDETGLKGSYDLTVNIARYMPQSGDGPPDPLSLIATALQEELGLKLESRKMVVPMVVVDRAEKTPTEN